MTMQTLIATRIAQIEDRLPALRAHLAATTLASVKDLTAGKIARLEAERDELKNILR